ncbi:MAG: hypothetical protein LBM01_00475 [Christensenellaceae bacterium]|jgi:hypothetical protein|nr:hypothetical protein [Christensenellaceae bacterium]
MSILIDGKEIELNENLVRDEWTRDIRGDKYISTHETKMEFESAIHSYKNPNEKILISYTEQFQSLYHQIVFFDDEKKAVWDLATVPVQSKTNIRRMGDKLFFITSLSHRDGVQSQVSFHKLGEKAGSADEIIMNFTKLNLMVDLFNNETFLIDYVDKDPDTGVEQKVLAFYTYKGKLLATFFDYKSTDLIQYSATLVGEVLYIMQLTTDGERVSTVKVDLRRFYMRKKSGEKLVQNFDYRYAVIREPINAEKGIWSQILEERAAKLNRGRGIVEKGKEKQEKREPAKTIQTREVVYKPIGGPDPEPDFVPPKKEAAKEAAKEAVKEAVKEAATPKEGATPKKELEFSSPKEGAIKKEETPKKSAPPKEDAPPEKDLGFSLSRLKEMLSEE